MYKLMIRKKDSSIWKELIFDAEIDLYNYINSIDFSIYRNIEIYKKQKIGYNLMERFNI